jgi:hypothetical protein
MSVAMSPAPAAGVDAWLGILCPVVIASEAKQSSKAAKKEDWIASELTLLAMTEVRGRASVAKTFARP